MELIPEFLQAKYDNVELIGEGGYARVYKCERTSLITAVKLLFGKDSESRLRFKGEIDTLRCIDHKNVVKVLDAGETDGHHWYELEYASQGHFGNMASYLFYNDWDRVEYFSQICLGVQAFHDLDPPRIHRDLKPANILVFEYLEPERHTVLKIADLGLVAIAGAASGITATGDVLGTADYVAPERKKNPRIKTPQSDLYSLGITFLEACTGKVTPIPENLARVPELLIPIIEKMVQQNPRNRYQSVIEVLEAFNGLPFDRLCYGREFREDEQFAHTFHVNIGRELENELDLLLKCNADNVLARLEVLGLTLDRLGDAPDHEAQIIMNISRGVLALIEQADWRELERLIQRFDNAVRKTTEQDFFSPSPQSWSRFLADAFDVSSIFATKSLCLEGVVYFLERFGSPGTKHYLCRTIEVIEDPNDMEELVRCLRQVGREDVASLLDGVPDQRDLDLEAVKSALRGSE